MTHRAFSFTIDDPHEAGHVGLALVSPTARYACIHTVGGPERMARRHATPAEWRDVDAELNPPTEGTLYPGSLLRRIILGGEERSLRVTFVKYDDLEIASTAEVSGALDRHLREMAGATS